MSTIWLALCLFPCLGFMIYSSKELTDLQTFLSQLLPRDSTPHRAQIINKDRIFVVADHGICSTTERPYRIDSAPTLLSVIEEAIASMVSQEHITIFAISCEFVPAVTCLLNKPKVLVRKKHLSFFATDTAVGTPHSSTEQPLF